LASHFCHDYLNSEIDIFVVEILIFKHYL
jgi:hypothetical protein